MSISKKMLQAAAGQAGGGALAIEDVFSTYLYTGNGSTQTITNGIDLAGEGGLVWLKDRNSGFSLAHGLTDTERGFNKLLVSNTTGAEITLTNLCITGFNSDGFGLGTNSNWNNNGTAFASWTFRKAPRFFDVVTYTGTGSARTVSHNLGVAPGMVIVKRTNSADEWTCYHRSVGATKWLALNQTAAAYTSASRWNDTEPTDSVFTVGTDTSVNSASGTYVAYLFAHDPLGPSGDGSDGLIACGSYTNASTVDLGWEPQWVMLKRSSGAAEWFVFDNMRGVATGNLPSYDLNPNSSNAEGANTDVIEFNATGFKVKSFGTSFGSGDYIYIAIRRGPMRQPESGTEVFEPSITFDEVNDPGFNSGFVTDMAWYRRPLVSDEMRCYSRLNQGGRLRFDSSLSEAADAGVPFDFNDGVDAPTNDTARGWLWKRAPGFFDVVAYTGNSTAGRTVSHNLGVAPEMIWVKNRNDIVNWIVYHSEIGSTKFLILNQTNAEIASTGTWNDTNPTDNVFSLGTASGVNGLNDPHIAYLFATLPGVSKVGSYTGNGTSQTIDCGFTSGARFILIKRTDSTGDWYIWDTERGIVTGNDPHLSLNTSAAEVTSDDSIDPDSSGFIVNQVAATNINVSSASYIFYAIA